MIDLSGVILVKTTEQKMVQSVGQWVSDQWHDMLSVEIIFDPYQLHPPGGVVCVQEMSSK